MQGKAGYGLVLALQLTVPCTRLTLVQSLSADYPDHPRQMFRLEVSDIQTAVALEDNEQDIRFGSLALASSVFPVLFTFELYQTVLCLIGLEHRTEFCRLLLLCEILHWLISSAVMCSVTLCWTVLICTK